MTGPIDDDARIIADLADALETAEPLPLTLAPLSAVHLAGLIQLAIRHPSVGAASRLIADRFLTAVRLHYADVPAVLEVLDRGDDPRCDR